MMTTVSKNHMVTIPAEIERRYGIQPGYRLEWRAGKAPDEIRVRVVPDRAGLARRLLGAGRRFSPGADAVEALLAERAEEAE